MLTRDETRYFEDLAFLEQKYLAGTNPRQQSGFGRDERDWERFRRPVVVPVRMHGTFLDIGFANGLLMESVVRWAHEDGLRTEVAYVPAARRRNYVERLLESFAAPNGRLIVCSYGSSRPEGARAETLESHCHGPGHHLGSNGIHVDMWNFLKPLADIIDDQDVLTRYSTILHLLNKQPFDAGAQPWQDMATLVKLRNELVHYKSRGGNNWLVRNSFARSWHYGSTSRHSWTTIRISSRTTFLAPIARSGRQNCHRVHRCVLREDRNCECARSAQGTPARCVVRPSNHDRGR